MKKILKKKFTEGSWISVGYRIDTYRAWGLSGICEMSDWMDDAEMEANAKLIAAAPELLEAAEKALALLKNIEVRGDCVNSLSAAIEKALK